MATNKIKATDYLIESLKLITVIVTILITGMLTFQSQINNSNKIYFYISIFFWMITLVLSVINLNLLINKIYRGEEDAIKQKDTKTTFVIASFSLFFGMISAIIFLYNNIPTSNKMNKVQKNQILITNDTIIMDSNFSKKIKIIKFKEGSIKEVTIN